VAAPQPLIFPEPTPGILLVGKARLADLEYRSNRNFWLKLAVASVSYSVVASFAGLYWQQTIYPVLLAEGSGAAWRVLVALSSILVWGVLPVFAAIFLLGRLYGLNFFVLLWRQRKASGDIGARLFTMLVATVSASLSIWVVIGPILGEKYSNYAFPVLLFIVICSAVLSDGVVHGERALAQHRAAHEKTEEANA
jgi:hypothetical protein